MRLVFDMIMGDPVFGHPTGGTLSAMVALGALCVILAMILKLHLQKYTDGAVFYVVIMVLSFIAGRIYMRYLMPENKSLLPSGLAPPMFFKMVVPVFIYNTYIRLESIKFLNHTQLFYILLVSIIAYAVSFLLQLVIVYALIELCFDWSFRTTLVLVVCIALYQTEGAFELLESKGGHVKYLQAALKSEMIWNSMVSYSIVDALMKYEPLPMHPSWEDSAKFTFRVFMAVFGLVYGFLLGFLVQPLYVFSYNSPKVAPLVSLLSCIFVYSSSELLTMSGCSAVSGFAAVMTTILKPKMLAAHETFTKSVWRMMWVMATSSVCTLGGFVLGACSRQLDIRLFCFGFGLFALSLMVRLLVIFFIFPYLNSGNATRWEEMGMVVVGPYRGVGTLLLALWYSTNNGDEEFLLLMIVIIVLMLSLFTNVILIDWIVERLDVFHLSKAQISNMNVAVDQINKCRGNMIFAEKLDRFIADANWSVVHRITSFNHPYQHRVRTTEFAESFKEDVKLVQCPRCGKTTVAPPTRKEIDEITRETKLRVMKAQQVSYIKQQEAGTLTPYGYKFLSNLIYQACYSEEISVNTDDLRILAEDLKFYKQMREFFKRIFEMTEEMYEWQPTNKLRLECYYITISQGFRIAMAVVSLLDMFLCLTFVGLYAYHRYGEGYLTSMVYFGQILSVLFIIFYLMNLIEALIQFLGVGLWQYFSKTVYKIEFLSCVIMRSLQVFIFLYECSNTGKYLNMIDTSPPIVYLNVLLFLRVTRFYIFFVAVIPSILKRIEICIDQGHLKKYDVGKAYLVGLDRVLKYLGQLTTNELVRDEIKKEIEFNRQKVTKELGFIQKEHPNIAITVKTKHAIRHVINSMQECADGLHTEGILDMIEANALSESIVNVRKEMFKLEFIVPPLPINILKEISWLVGDEENTELFLNQAMMYNYDYNDYLIRNGDDPVGLYILVSGLLKASYVPSSTTIGLAHKFGALPCYDFFEHFKFDQPQESFIVSGNVVGELGLVTGRRYDMTLVADTAVQTYFLPDGLMKSLHETLSGRKLIARIWKKVAVRISVTLLQYTPAYRSWSQEKLYNYLQKGVLPDLTGIVAIALDGKTEEAVIIQGVALDPVNQSVIYGPYRIPRTVTKLMLPDHPSWGFQTVYETKIFLVLVSGVPVSDLLEVYTEPERMPQLVEETATNIRKKKHVDKFRKVGFAAEDDS